MHAIIKSAIVAATLSSVGCASIISDSTYPVTINSSPSDARFEITNLDSGMKVMSGQTPATVTLKAGNGFFDGAKYQVEFNKNGYDAQSFVIDSSLDGWYIGNVLFGGILGLLIIDPATGAMWKLDENLMVSLGKMNEMSMNEEAGDAQSLAFMTLDQVPAHLRENMVRID